MAVGRDRVCVGAIIGMAVGCRFVAVGREIVCVGRMMEVAVGWSGVLVGAIMVAVGVGTEGVGESGVAVGAEEDDGLVDIVDV